MISRRSLFAVTTCLSGLVAVTALGACSQVPLTPADIIADAQAAASGLSTALSLLSAAAPTLIPAATLASIQSDLATAQGIAKTLSASTPATSAASVVQQVLGYLNAALNVLAAPPINGLIPSPFNTAVAAVAVLAPEMEAFVTAYIPTAAASPVAVKVRAKLVAAAPAMTPAQARARLLKET